MKTRCAATSYTATAIAADTIGTSLRSRKRSLDYSVILGEKPIPLTLISQYLPLEYEAIRRGELQAVPERMIQYHIRRVLRAYADACSVEQPA